MAKVTFDGDNKLILVNNGITELDVKIDLYSDWKEWVVLSDNSKYEQAMRSVGGDPLTGTQNLGATFFLMNGWRIVPYSGDHRLTITGNLYTDPSGFSPVNTVPGYSIIVEYTVSNLVDSSVARLDIEELKYSIETLRPSHQGFGKSFFWDPLLGNDDNEGLSPQTPVATWTKAHSLVTDGANDTIYLISSSPTQLVITEQITISKTGLNLRGPGRSVKFLPTSTTGNTIEINAANVSLEGFIVECALANTDGDCIQVNGKFSKIENMWINRGGVNCLHYRTGEYHSIVDTIIEKSKGSGVRFTDAGLVDGSPREAVFERCQIYWNAGDGITITGTSANSSRLNQFNKCKIYANTGYGLNVGANTQRTLVAEDTQLFLNTAGDVLDNGTETVVLSYGSGMAGEVWNSLSADYTTGGTKGKELREVAQLLKAVLAKL
jgi:hypothetical protein